MSGRRWTVTDRYANEIYLTEERWHHIIEEINHPELAAYEAYVRHTVQVGRRKQDVLNPQKYRYHWAYDDLPAFNTHIVVIVLFRFTEDLEERPAANNYIVTAYMKEVWS